MRRVEGIGRSNDRQCFGDCSRGRDCIQCSSRLEYFIKMSWKKVVAITGCDSGLGWAMAVRAAELGIVTVAGLLNGTDTEAAKALKDVCIYTHELDVTSTKSVTEFKNYVMDLIKDNPEYKLHAIVNNAGVMIVGEHEWLTPKIIEETININLLGPMRIVSAFLPELRKNARTAEIKPRIINVGSHCGLNPLPGFGPYTASKAGLIAWTRTLYAEQLEHGLRVVSFIPGGFINASHLTSRQVMHANEMLKQLSEEQKSIYEKKILTLSTYLESISKNTRYDAMKDYDVVATFAHALTDEHPDEIYKVESWRYKFYFNLLNMPLLPLRAYQSLVRRFLKFPTLDN